MLPNLPVSMSSLLTPTVLLFASLLNQTSGAISQSEQAALRKFYLALGGDGWYDNSGWTGLFNTSEYKDPCQFHSSWGVGINSCNADNTSITGLSVTKPNNLSGTIPTETIIGLPNLTNFAINSQPQVSGSIPEALICGTQAAESMEYISLDLNSLSGYLPSQTCFASRSSDAQLGFFSADDNQISGMIPEGLVCGNPATDRIEVIRVDRNLLSGTLPSDKCLSNRSSDAVLDWFSAVNNRISGTFPEGIMCGNLAAERMQRLELSDNALSGTFPSETCLASRSGGPGINALYAQNNQISGTFPVGLVCGNPVTENMLDLFLHTNALSGTLPSERCLAKRSNAAKLRILRANNNTITGTIPEGLLCGNLAAERMLDLSLHNNALSGTLPTETCLAQRSNDSVLTRFAVQDNKISGTIPEGLVCGSPVADRMDRLDLSANALSGTLPSEVCLVSRSTNAALRVFRVSENQISGTIPEGLVCGNLAADRMEELRVHSNALSGTLPSEACLANRSSDAALSYLRTQENRISGTIPTSLICGSRNPLRVAILSKCQLSGTVSNCRGNEGANTNLTILDLSENNLSGSVPDMERWINLQVLSLNRNGKLGGSLNGLPPTLRYLVLEGSNLEGNIERLGYLTELEKVYMAGNYLSGTLPSSIFRNNRNLKEIVLSHNTLSGSLPDAVGGAKNLSKLLLDSNRINGRLPDRLASVLNGLKDISLELNEMSCDVPQPLKSWPSADSDTVEILQGNIFGCNGIGALRKIDSDGDSYVCGNEAYLVPFGVSVALLAIIIILGFIMAFIRLYYGVPQNFVLARLRVVFVWLFSDSESYLQLATLGLSRLAMLLVGISVLSLTIAMPIYKSADSRIECQYMNKMSLAFVQKSDGIGTYSIAWVVTTLLITSLAGVNLVLWRSRRRYDLAPNITEEKFGDLQLTQDLTFNSDVLQSSCALEAKEVKDVKEPVVNFNPTEYTRLEGMKDNEINATMKSFVTRLGYVAKATILLMLFLLLFGLIFSTSAAQVASDASTQINQTYKQLLTFALAAAHVILSLILPIFVDSIISLYSLWFRGGWAPEESSTFALILNTMLSTTLNILAPIGCESFISPSCLKPLIKTAKSYPSSPIETGVCSSFLIHAVTGEILGCDEYLVLETGSYTPPFHFRADYCTSQLVRVFAPFFISMVLQMLIAPFFLNLAPFIWADPLSQYGSLLGDFRYAIWPILTVKLKPRELVRVASSIVHFGYAEQLLLLGVMLTMGIAAPLVAAAVAFVSIALAFHYANMLLTIHSCIAGNEKARKLLHGTNFEVMPLYPFASPCLGALLFWGLFGWYGLNLAGKLECTLFCHAFLYLWVTHG
eukprot:jgi/Bigna1/129858/aug1.10_g4566